MPRRYCFYGPYLPRPRGVRSIVAISLYITMGCLLFTSPSLLPFRDKRQPRDRGAVMLPSSPQFPPFSPSGRLGYTGPHWLRAARRGGVGARGITSAAAAWRGVKGDEGRATYVSCIPDSPVQRSLLGAKLYDYHKMSVPRCLAYCSDRGFQFAGLEFGAECYCGNKLEAGTIGIKGTMGRVNGETGKTRWQNGGVSVQLQAGGHEGGDENTVRDEERVQAWEYNNKIAEQENEPRKGRAIKLNDKVKKSKEANIGRGGENHRSHMKNNEEGTCNMPCKGQPSATCGGTNYLSLYSLDAVVPSSRSKQHPDLWGCLEQHTSFPKPQIHKRLSNYTEHPNSIKPSTLTKSLDILPNISVPACRAHCSGKSLPFAMVMGSSCLCVPPSSLLLPMGAEGGQCIGGWCGGGANRCTEKQIAVYHTHLPDRSCLSRRLLPQRSTRLFALASFPGAGNTWLRHLLELTTGYYTGSVYFDGALYSKGFRGEREPWANGRLLAIKTHESGLREMAMFDGAILLLRNPYRSLTAEFNRRHGGHLGFAAPQHWLGNEWPEFVHAYAPWWASHALAWLQLPVTQLTVLHYETLLQNPAPELQRAAQFLSVPAPPARLLCTLALRDGGFKRGEGGHHIPSSRVQNPFTPKMRDVIEGFIRIVDSALRERNLSGLPRDYCCSNVESHLTPILTHDQNPNQVPEA
uniref:WSC domain containing 1b n=1 Tax=Eptatretus burgeri TaxID=7764 RepID=A0A8C4QLS9_EPTBU